jgi:hypothetical protein
MGAAINDNLNDCVATVGTLEVINYNPAIEYTYSDMSGSSSSVVIHQGSKLTRGGIAGIVVAAVGALVIIVGALVYWLRRRSAINYAESQHDTEDPEIVADKGEVADARYPEDLVPALNIEVQPGRVGRRSEP